MSKQIKEQENRKIKKMMIRVLRKYYFFIRWVTIVYPLKIIQSQYFDKCKISNLIQNNFPTKDEIQTTVVYLLRLESELERTSFNNFLQSLRTYSIGTNCDFIVILKGRTAQRTIIEIKEKFADFKPKFFFDKPTGQDIGSYIRIISKVKTPFVFFLNTHSAIECDNWLTMYENVAANLKTKVVGSSGSYGRNGLPKYNRIFPNPHLRTNAFLVDVKLFSDVTKNIKIKNKSDAYLFESGPKSFTNELCKWGVMPVIIGKNSQFYEISKWPISNTFFFFNQSNLVISDNVTRRYTKENLIMRLKYSYVAWYAY